MPSSPANKEPKTPSISIYTLIGIFAMVVAIVVTVGRLVLRH